MHHRSIRSSRAPNRTSRSEPHRRWIISCFVQRSRRHRPAHFPVLRRAWWGSLRRQASDLDRSTPVLSRCRVDSRSRSTHPTDSTRAGPVESGRVGRADLGYGVNAPYVYPIISGAESHLTQRAPPTLDYLLLRPTLEASAACTLPGTSRSCTSRNFPEHGGARSDVRRATSIDPPLASLPSGFPKSLDPRYGLFRRTDGAIREFRMNRKNGRIERRRGSFLER